MTPDSSTSFEKTTELKTGSPTLIEGLPGLGMVAAIAVDQITKQLELDQHGTIVSDDFPPVARGMRGFPRSLCLPRSKPIDTRSDGLSH